MRRIISSPKIIFFSSSLKAWLIYTASTTFEKYFIYSINGNFSIIVKTLSAVDSGKFEKHTLPVEVSFKVASISLITMKDIKEQAWQLSSLTRSSFLLSHESSQLPSTLNSAYS